MGKILKKLLLTLSAVILSINLFAQQPTIITLVNEDGGVAACDITLFTDQGETRVLFVQGSAMISDISGIVVQINFLPVEGLILTNTYKVDDYHFVAIFKNDDTEEEQEE